MQFVNPSFLYALAVLAIPVIIHLFHFRRYKKVFFPNVKFLEEVEIQSKRQSKLRDLLILIARLLALAALVFAFAQPFIPVDKQSVVGGEHAVSVYVDNSFSMDSRGREGFLLDMARKKAREIALAYSTADKFQLLTNEFEGVQQRWITREEFLKSLDDIKLSPVSRTLPEIISRQRDLLSGITKGNRHEYILSDFQKSFTTFKNVKNDSSIRTFLVPVIPQGVTNIYVDSVWMENPVFQPGMQVQLSVKIVNTSDAKAEKIPVKLVLNGVQRAVASVDLAGNESRVVNMTFSIRDKGLHQGFVEITDYPIVYDDRYYLGFDAVDRFNVMLVNGNGGNPYIDKLFEGDSAVNYKVRQEKSLNFNEFTQNDLVILSGIENISTGLGAELSRFVKQGGSLLVIPPVKAQLESYKAFLQGFGMSAFEKPDTTDTRATNINLQHPLFRNVFENMPQNMQYPEIKMHFSQAGNKGSGESLIKLLNGDDLLSVATFGKGRVYLSSVDFNDAFGNFHKQAIFVPTLFNIALYSRKTGEISYTIGKDQLIPVQNRDNRGDKVLKLRNEKGDFEIIPEIRPIDETFFIHNNNQVKEAGNYRLYSENTLVGGISYNYNRNESQPITFQPEELSKKLTDLNLNTISVFDTGKTPVAKAIAKINQGTTLWRWFLWASLLFLLAEVFIIRFWKK